MCRLLLVCSPGAALCWSAVCGISAWRNFYSRTKWKELAPRGKLAFPSWGSASDLVASTSVHHHRDICVQQHTLGKKFCSHLYPLHWFQAILSLVHWKDYMILVCITLVFLSYQRLLGNLQQCSSHQRPLTFPLALTKELCSSMKDALLSYTRTPSASHLENCSVVQLVSSLLDLHSCSSMYTTCTHSYIWDGFGFHKEDFSQSLALPMGSLSRHRNTKF